MGSSMLFVLTYCTLRMTWMRPGNVAFFLPLPPHPSAEDGFSPAAPSPAFACRMLSPWAGCRLVPRVGGHAVLYPPPILSPVCACGSTIALAVSCCRWDGASCWLLQERPLCSCAQVGCAQVGCGAAAGGDQNYSWHWEKMHFSELRCGHGRRHSGSLAARSLSLLGCVIPLQC